MWRLFSGIPSHLNLNAAHLAVPIFKALRSRPVFLDKPIFRVFELISIF